MEISDAEPRAAGAPWLSVLLTAAMVIATLGGSWMLVLWLEQSGFTAAVRQRGGILAAAVLVVIHAVVAISPAPGEAVAIANSAIYGFGWGVVMNWSGWMIAAVFEFALLRRAVQWLSLESSLERAPRWLRRLPVGRPLFLIAGRWVPFGSLIVSAAAALKATFWRHMWCSAIGIVPVAIFFSAIANGWRLFS